jgi:hypothetical protein
MQISINYKRNYPAEIVITDLTEYGMLKAPVSEGTDIA